MTEDRTGIGGLLKERIARFRHLLVHKLNAKEIKVGSIKEKVSSGGVTSTGVWDFTGGIKTDAIDESTGAAGVTIDSLLTQDGHIVFDEIGTPAAPSQNSLRLYVKADGDNIELWARSSIDDKLIISLGDTAVEHTNTLALNWVQ